MTNDIAFTIYTGNVSEPSDSIYIRQHILEDPQAKVVSLPGWPGLTFIDYTYLGLLHTVAFGPPCNAYHVSNLSSLRSTDSYREFNSRFRLGGLTVLAETRVDPLQRQWGPKAKSLRECFQDPYKVGTPHLVITRKLRGKGLGTLLYRRYLSKGWSFATSTHTDSAAKLWESLARALNIEVLNIDPATCVLQRLATPNSYKILVNPKNLLVRNQVQDKRK